MSQREKIAAICKYADIMIEDAKKDPDNQARLLELAENTLVEILNQYDVECIDPETGFILSKLGEVKLLQQEYDVAKQYYLEALTNLIVRGEFCQDRAKSHAGLGKSFFMNNDLEQAKNHYIRAINIYDNLSMFKELHEIVEPEFKLLNLKIEDYLPAKELSPEGIPVKCRECGNNSFNLIEESEERLVYECKSCQCRNVVLTDMLQVNATQ